MARWPKKKISKKNLKGKHENPFSVDAKRARVCSHTHTHELSLLRDISCERKVSDIMMVIKLKIHSRKECLNVLAQGLSHRKSTHQTKNFKRKRHAQKRFGPTRVIVCREWRCKAEEKFFRSLLFFSKQTKFTNIMLINVYTQCTYNMPVSATRLSVFSISFMRAERCYRLLNKGDFESSANDSICLSLSFCRTNMVKCVHKICLTSFSSLHVIFFSRSKCKGELRVTTK